jgi:hypothetical protein
MRYVRLTAASLLTGFLVGTRLYLTLAIRGSDIRSMRNRWEKLEEEASAARAETRLTIEIGRIDVLPRRSASKV